MTLYENGKGKMAYLDYSAEYLLEVKEKAIKQIPNVMSLRYELQTKDIKIDMRYGFIM